MPDKPLTVLTYAASASLAAVALVYFFNPNHLIDGESSSSTASARKKGVVGLVNPANDCFINSVLQSLAGLGDLRVYLIRELHRRKLDGPETYESLPERGPNEKPLDVRKIKSLQNAEVTKGLKDMIDRLNERPIQKKTISAAKFIISLERAFGTRISKSQQDAQELLQVVAERLSEEYHAGRAARLRAIGSLTQAPDQPLEMVLGDDSREELEELVGKPSISGIEAESILRHEEGFPLEGQTKSEIECQHCHFVPKANPVSFVMLTLNVPQKSNATLNECYDAQFKTEYIDDYKCDRCRLDHAISVFTKELSRAKDPVKKELIEENIAKLERAREEDPEKPPEDVQLPDKKLEPERRIARHVQITTFPKILVIHLSRSIFDPRSYSTKNAAKVSFPETFPLGGLLNRRNYKLLGLVSHKGTHNSGHYESFRRQHVYAPFATPLDQNGSSPYSPHIPTPPTSVAPSPQISSSSHFESHHPSSPSLSPYTTLDASLEGNAVPHTSGSPTPSISSHSNSNSHSTGSTRPSSGSISSNGTCFSHRKTVVPPQSSSSAHQLDGIVERDLAPSHGDNHASRRSSQTTRKDSLSQKTPQQQQQQQQSAASLPTRTKKLKKSNDRWWRISDEKIKECKTSDVLGMQREVYMLFYEMERDSA
ncbi:hypothetical protein MMC25_001144 [Agyrium rufum]|nr:hypothetical protein [Agyrium rufum]